MAVATMENQMDSRLTALKVSLKVLPGAKPYLSMMTLSFMNCCVIAPFI